MENPAFVDIDLENDPYEKNIESEKPPEKVYSIEEAATLAGTGVFHYFLLLVSGLCFMSVMVETMGIGLILPYFQCDLESTIQEQGLVASSGFLGIVLSSHAMGFFADTWGRIKTLRTALVCGFITTFISALSVNIWMLILFRFLNGFAISGCQACVFSFVGEFHGSKTRVKYVTLLSTFLPLGLMFLPALAMLILPLQFNVQIVGLSFTPWRVLLLANSLLSLLALCGLLVLNESPKYDLIQGRSERALQTFRKVFKLNTGRPESEYPVKKISVEISGANLSNVHGVMGAFSLVWSQTVPLFNKDRFMHTINICCIMFVIFAIAQGTFMWFPTMLSQLVDKSDGEVLVCDVLNLEDISSNNGTNTGSHCGGPVNTEMFEILTMIGATFTAIYLVFSFTIDYIGKRNLLIAWLVVAAGSCLLIHWISSFTLSVILLTLTMSTGTCGGIVSTVAMEYYPTNVNAMAMCLIMMCGRMGAVVGSNFVGRAIFSNCDMLFYVYVGVITLIAFLTMFLPIKEKNSKSKTERMDKNAKTNNP